MKEKEVIYIAKPNWWVEQNYPGYKKFFQEFYTQLKDYHEVQVLDLPDICVRDFLPIQNQKTGQLYQMFFDPRYANYTAKFTKAIRKEVFDYFPRAKPCDVRMDGGNIVLTPNKKYAFCLEKQTIFRKSAPSQKEYVEQELKQSLGIEEILWFPQQYGDKIGHIDGYIQFLGHSLMEGKIDLELDIIDGEAITPSLLNQKGMERLYEYCENKNIINLENELVYLLCKDTTWSSAKGIYVNFLETSLAVFVPQFNWIGDDIAIRTIKSYTSKPIVKVDCSKIAEYGGAVHCLTKEYWQ